MHRRAMPVFATGLILVSACAFGEDFTFDGGPDGTGTSWTVAANWSPDGVPGAGDRVVIGSDGPPATTYSVSLDTSVDLAEMHVRGGSSLALVDAATITVAGAASFSGDGPGGGGAAFVDVFGDGAIVLDGDATYRSIGLSGSVSLVVNGSLTGSPGGFWAQLVTTGADTSLTVNGDLNLAGGDGEVSSARVGSITVNPGGSIQLTSAGASVDAAGTGTVTNHGTITVDCGDDATSTVFDLGTSDGVIDVLSGTLVLDQGVSTISGDVMVAADATLQCAGNATYEYAFTGTLSGDGRLLISARVILDDFDATIGLVEMSGIVETNLMLSGDSTTTGGFVGQGAITGIGSWTVGGPTTFIAGSSLTPDVAVVLDGPSTFEGLAILAGSQLAINGDALLGAGFPSGINGAGAVTIGPDATVTMDGVTRLNAGPGSSSLGTIVKIGAGEAEMIDANGGVANDGLIQVLEGTLAHWTNGVQSGDVEIAEGAQYRALGGTSTVDSAWTGDGMLAIAADPFGGNSLTHDGTIDVASADFGGLVRGTGSIAVDSLVIGNCRLRDSITLVAGDVVQDDFTFQDDASTVRVTGTAIKDWLWRMTGTSRLEIDGEFEWRNGPFDNPDDGGSLAILSGGTLVQTGGGGLDCSIPFENSGQIVLRNAGIARFFNAGASVNDGAIVIESGTTQYWDGEPVQGPGGATILAGGGLLRAASESIEFAEGLFGGVGSIIENVNAPATTISPGLSPGTLVIDGDLALGADSAFVAELAGEKPGEFDVLTVTGTATLGGTVIVGYPGDYRPPAGTTFTILTAANVVGEFDAVAGLGEYALTTTATSVILEVLDPDVSCPSDADGSNDTSAVDLGLILGAWGPCDGCQEDLDGDGVVDAVDLGLLLGGWGPCPENVAYDVTFSSPLHTVGETPAVGAGVPVRRTVTFVGGTYPPRVVSAVGALDEQPLLFEYDGSSRTGIRVLDLPASPRWRIELDVLVQAIDGPREFFRVFARAVGAGETVLVPSVQFFESSMVVRAGPMSSTELPYASGEIVRLRFEFDLEAGTADTFVNDELVGGDSGAPGAALYELDFAGFGRAGDSVAVDNIRITAIE